MDGLSDSKLIRESERQTQKYLLKSNPTLPPNVRRKLAKALVAEAVRNLRTANA